MSQQMLYAIYDLVAEEYVGGVQIHRHDASAIRVFGDILSTSGSMPNQHPEDYELHYIGELYNEPHSLLDGPHAVVINPLDYRTVITGKLWIASQQEASDNG